jgi:hypothetical protein
VGRVVSYSKDLLHGAKLGRKDKTRQLLTAKDGCERKRAVVIKFS